MKFKYPDTNLEDFQRRRRAFLKMVKQVEPDLKRRLVIIRNWFDVNSPYEPREKLQNLLRVIYGDERH